MPLDDNREGGGLVSPRYMIELRCRLVGCEGGSCEVPTLAADRPVAAKTGRSVEAVAHT